MGLRGASTASLLINPDFGFGLDTTIAYDTPGSTEREQVSKLGSGPCIKIMDSQTICDYRMVNYMKKISNEKKINSDEEYRNKNLDQLLIEQKEWELRKKQSLERCENLSQKKENLSKEIIDLVKINATTKFDESIDVSLRINLKQSKGGDLSLRTVVKLPNGSGKISKIPSTFRQSSCRYYNSVSFPNIQ